jgi:hypothetical protein
MRRPRAADGRPLGVNRAPWYAIWLILSAGVLLLVTFVLSRKTGASEGVTLFVANFDTEKVLERSLGVTNQSTIVVFRDGKETARSTGETQQASLIEILRRAIP